MQDVVCQMMAGYYVTKFNEAMQHYKRDIQVQFLPAAHLQLLTPYGDVEDCITLSRTSMETSLSSPITLLTLTWNTTERIWLQHCRTFPTANRKEH